MTTLRRSGLRVLVVTPVSPFPTRNGLHLRMAQAINAISDAAAVSVLTFVSGDRRQRVAQRNALEASEVFERVHVVPHPEREDVWRVLTGFLRGRPAAQIGYQSRAFLAKLRELVEPGEFDYCLFLGGGTLVPYTQHVNGVRVGIDLCDDLLAAYGTLASISSSVLRGAYLHVQKTLMRMSLVRDLQAVDDVVVISGKDRRWLHPFPEVATYVVPNHVDESFLEERREFGGQQPTLLFVGSMGSPENRDAVGFFIREVLPRIAASEPRVRFRIVGAEAEGLQIPSTEVPVELQGFVPDLRPEYQACTIFVCPLRAGSGVKNKTLEAMAVGCAIVSSSVGAEGIDVTGGVEMEIADTPDDFAQRVVDLLGDEGRRERMGRSARQVVIEQFSREAVATAWQGLVRPGSLGPAANR